MQEMGRIQDKRKMRKKREEESKKMVLPESTKCVRQTYAKRGKENPRRVRILREGRSIAISGEYR